MMAYQTVRSFSFDTECVMISSLALQTTISGGKEYQEINVRESSSDQEVHVSDDNQHQKTEVQEYVHPNWDASAAYNLAKDCFNTARSDKLAACNAQVSVELACRTLQSSRVQ